MDEEDPASPPGFEAGRGAVQVGQGRRLDHLTDGDRFGRGPVDLDERVGVDGLGDALEQAGPSQRPGEVDDVGSNRVGVDLEGVGEVVDEVRQRGPAVEELPDEPGRVVEDQGLAEAAQEHRLTAHGERVEVRAEPGYEAVVDVVGGDDGVDVGHGAVVGSGR